MGLASVMVFPVIAPSLHRSCRDRAPHESEEATGTLNIHLITRFPSIIVIGDASIILPTLTIASHWLLGKVEWA